MGDALDRRCGTCARFVRVVERIAPTGEVTRVGDCLLGVWQPPLYETSTCSQYVRRGEFKLRPEASRSTRGAERSPRRSHDRRPTTSSGPPIRSLPSSTAFPEDLLEMDSEEFRKILSDVIRHELGVGEVDLAGKWDGGEIVLKPGKEGMQEKRIPVEALFHKIVMVRDRLRVLEQKINGHPKLGDDEKVQLQQYVTACYGSLTTFNVLFANRDDQFVGQKGDE